MKKFLTVLLVLVLALSIAAPALAAESGGLFGENVTNPGSVPSTGKALTARKTKVYATPDTNGKVLGTLYKGESVEVVDNYAGWAQIIWGRRDRGYILSDDVEFNPVRQYNFTEATVLKETNVFESAKASAEILGYFTRGQSVKVVNVTGAWAEIMWYGWRTAYVAAADISLLGGVPVNKPFTAPGTQPPQGALATAYALQNTNVRTGPATTYKIIGGVKKGDYIQITDASNKKWFKINYFGTEAYVFKNNFSAPKSPSAQTPVKGYTGAQVYAALEKSGFFDMYAAYCLGCYTDANDMLVIRMVSNVDLELLMDEVARQIKGAAANVKLVRSSMASYVTPAYITDVMALARGNYFYLRPTERAYLGIAYWGYDPRSDSFRVGLENNDKAVKAFFKEYVLDWAYTSFERAGKLSSTDKAFLSAPALYSSSLGTVVSPPGITPATTPGASYWMGGQWVEVQGAMFGAPSTGRAKRP